MDARTLFIIYVDQIYVRKWRFFLYMYKGGVLAPGTLDLQVLHSSYDCKTIGLFMICLIYYNSFPFLFHVPCTLTFYEKYGDCFLESRGWLSYRCTWTMYFLLACYLLFLAFPYTNTSFWKSVDEFSQADLLPTDRIWPY